MRPTIEEESRLFEHELRGIAHLEGPEQRLALTRVGRILVDLGCTPADVDGVLRRLVRTDAVIELDVGREVSELRVLLPEDMS